MCTYQDGARSYLFCYCVYWQLYSLLSNPIHSGETLKYSNMQSTDTTLSTFPFTSGIVFTVASFCAYLTPQSCLHEKSCWHLLQQELSVHLMSIKSSFSQKDSWGWSKLTIRTENQYTSWRRQPWIIILYRPTKQGRRIADVEPFFLANVLHALGRDGCWNPAVGPRAQLLIYYAQVNHLMPNRNLQNRLWSKCYFFVT